MSQKALVDHREPAPLAQHAVFSSPVHNGSDPGTAAAVAYLDSNKPRPLSPQAPSQNQAQGQLLVSDSRTSSGSAGPCLTQQKPLSTAAPGPAETNSEVWAQGFSRASYLFL